MALSESEHNLLVETCGNMNNAAGVCREVLEMLRNLGNTGVVDIAEHENDTSVHAADTTIARLSRLSSPEGDKFALGDDFSGVSSFEGVYTSAPKPFAVKATAGRTALLGFQKTMANALSYPFLIKFDEVATDSSGNLVEMADVPTSTFERDGLIISYGLGDSSQNRLSSAISFRIGRRGFRSGESVATAKASSIGFEVSGGEYGNRKIAASLDYEAFFPGYTAALDLGLSNSDYRFKDLYIQNSPTVGSDRRLKKDIASLDMEAMSFIRALRPVEFRLIDGKCTLPGIDENGGKIAATRIREGRRKHWGFIAQEVKEAMTQAGIDDAGVWSLADKDDPDSTQSLRYEELIAPLVKAVQVLAAKVEALEGK